MPSQKRLPAADEAPESGMDENAMDDDEKQQDDEVKVDVELENGHGGDENGVLAEEENETQPKEEENDYEEDHEDEESGASPSIEGTDENECILVKLADIRKEVQCPICLGIIKKTRTVMECLHRFCRDCIDKSMRLGNNECPACRTHCASRRSLRDDPNYDALIAALYPDIEKYEEEELTFYEEEKNRNNKIQLSIAATLRRQAEALGKRRSTRNRRGRSRSFMNFRISQGSDDDDDVNTNDWERDPIPTEEPSMDVRPKRHKRSTPRPSRPMVPSDADEGWEENDGERETPSTSPVRIGNREIPVWGKGGARSQTRHGGSINCKNIKGSRVSKMVDYLSSCAKNDNELDVHLTLLPLGDQPALERPHICCRPTITIGHISKFLAHQTSMQVDEIEIMARKPHKVSPRLDSDRFPCNHATSDYEYHILGEQETVDGLYACFSSSYGNLVLVYRLKLSK